MKTMYAISALLLALSLVGCQSLSGAYQWSNGYSEGTINLKKIPETEKQSQDYIDNQNEIPTTNPVPDALLPSSDGVAIPEIKPVDRETLAHVGTL